MLDRYQFARKEFEANEYRVQISKLVAPQVSYRDGPIMNLQLEDIGVLGTNSTKLDRSYPVGFSVDQQARYQKTGLVLAVPEFGLSTSVEM